MPRRKRKEPEHTLADIERLMALIAALEDIRKNRKENRKANPNPRLPGKKFSIEVTL